MTVVEAAVRLNITYDLVLRYLRTGILKGRKRSRMWEVDAASVSARMRKVADGRARRLKGANSGG